MQPQTPTHAHGDDGTDVEEEVVVVVLAHDSVRKRAVVVKPSTYMRQDCFVFQRSWRMSVKVIFLAVIPNAYMGEH